MKTSKEVKRNSLIKNSDLVKIKKVDIDFIYKIIESIDTDFKYSPLGKFYAPYSGVENGMVVDGFIACDNSTGDAWTEFFDLEDRCLIWLIKDSLTITQANFTVVPEKDINGNLLGIEYNDWGQ